MRPEKVLRLDPTPGSAAAVDRVSGVLRSVVLALAQSRQQLRSAAGPASVGQGPGGSVVGETAELTEAMAATAGEEGDSVTGLASALAALTAGVEQWIAAAAARLDATVVSLEDAAEVTASMSVLLGLGDGLVTERTREVAALAPGSHRLTLALSATWTRDAADLPEASFDEAAAGSLADRLPASTETLPEEHS